MIMNDIEREQSMLAKQALSIELAKKIATAAIAEAKRNDWAVAVTVVDDGGHLMYLERLDDTRKASSVIATKKAKTAILFKRPPAAIEKAITGGRQAMMILPGAIPIEGGTPLSGRR
jgi:glc operon protein GlcG